MGRMRQAIRAIPRSLALVSSTLSSLRRADLCTLSGPLIWIGSELPLQVPEASIVISITDLSATKIASQTLKVREVRRHIRFSSSTNWFARIQPKSTQQIRTKIESNKMSAIQTARNMYAKKMNCAPESACPVSIGRKICVPVDQIENDLSTVS